MSVELIGLVITAVALLVGFFGAFGWMIKRSDGQFAAVRGEMRAEFAAVRSDIGAVREELVEVKIAVARLEGPPRRLVAGR